MSNGGNGAVTCTTFGELRLNSSADPKRRGSDHFLLIPLAEPLSETLLAVELLGCSRLQFRGFHILGLGAWGFRV